MDVKALYPSLDIDFADRKMCWDDRTKWHWKCEHSWDGPTSLPSWKKKKYQGYCATRKKNGRIQPSQDVELKRERKNDENYGIKTSCKNQKKTNWDALRRTVAYALGLMMKTVLKNHILRFKDDVRKQPLDCNTLHGLIGQRETKLSKIWIFTSDTLMMSMSSARLSKDENQEPDRRMMTRFQEIGNKIHPSIQITIYFLSNSSNGGMPVLDTENWKLNLREKTTLHSHYSKPKAVSYLHNPYQL